MNRETIIQMAREAGLAEVTDTAESLPADYVEALAKLCALAVAKEPTGMPELPEPVANVSASSPVGGIGFVKPDKSYFTEDQMRAYGEQCWKSGYKHGAWGDNKQTSKQSLQVEPAVNQQLTTEPVDERAAFEREMKKRLTSPLSFDRHEANTNAYAYLTTAVAWAAWQARAAMAQVGDINVVESFTNDTKDAERYRWLRDDTDSDWAICEWSHAPGDEGYYRDARAPHIVDAAIDAAMAKGVKG